MGKNETFICKSCKADLVTETSNLGERKGLIGNNLLYDLIIEQIIFNPDQALEFFIKRRQQMWKKYICSNLLNSYNKYIVE